jgi:hypothetical protein
MARPVQAEEAIGQHFDGLIKRRIPAEVRSRGAAGQLAA